MEPPSKLAEIKLVSKYYPVANYSYPRGDDTNITYSTSRTLQDRTSVSSESSTPGLVEDGTNSELSQEDDYQYHAHATELWDSFWRPGGEWRLEEQQSYLKQHNATKKDHPVLAPTSPRHRRQTSQKSEGCTSPSWPLPDSFPVEERPRKPAAAYSAFPTRKISIIAPKQPHHPPPPPPPAKTQQRHPRNPPQRPPRPDSKLLTPCLQQPASVPLTFATPATPPDEPPPRNPARLSKPASQSSSAEEASVRLTKSMDGRPTDANPFGIHNAAAHSSTDLTQRGLQRAATSREPNHNRTTRHYKSTTHLAAARQQYQKLQQQHELEQQRQAEPRSVFEEDSDCEEDDSSGVTSFFRFHKRSGSSDNRTKMGEVIFRRRSRADTSPSLPMPALFKQNHHQHHHQQQQQQPERERKVDVFGRMLGRRSG